METATLARHFLSAISSPRTAAGLPVLFCLSVLLFLMVSKAWMNLMNQFTPAPGFAKLYLLKTRYRSTPKGEWFTFEASQFVQDYAAGAVVNE